MGMYRIIREGGRGVGEVLILYAIVRYVKSTGGQKIPNDGEMVTLSRVLSPLGSHPRIPSANGSVVVALGRNEESAIIESRSLWKVISPGSRRGSWNCGVGSSREV